VPRRSDPKYYKKVKTIALAELIREYNPTCVKIDIEGSEFEALKGIRLPLSLRFIVVEFHGKPERIDPILRGIERQGYAVAGYNPQSRYTLQTIKFDRGPTIDKKARAKEKDND
jgi:hypothetical protein